MNVILATDGAIESDIARAVFVKLPLPKDAAITVAMATELPIDPDMGLAPLAIGPGAVLAAETRRIQRQVAGETVKRVAASLCDDGMKAEGIVLDGQTAEALLDLIVRDHADLVVAGCGVNSSFAAFFLGSVSRKLVLHSDASVLIGRHYAAAKPRDSFAWIAKRPMLDLLVAVDGSEGSNLSIQSLARIAEPAFDQVYVAAIGALPCFNAFDPVAVLPVDYCDSEATEAIAREAVAAIGSCGRNVQALTTAGRPSSEIIRLAEERDVDLIMLGANRHGALDRLLLGSCAFETATGAPCSVLILRNELPFA